MAILLNHLNCYSIVYQKVLCEVQGFHDTEGLGVDCLGLCIV